LDRLQLKRPCLNCPFSRHPERIRFRCRERAEEIEELAYRQGFPCHLSGEDQGDDFDGEDQGIWYDEKTQHCAGAIFLRINEGTTEWPALDNEELPDDYLKRVGPYLLEGWDDDEEFFAANEATDEAGRAG
jgi:hypothetical protein